MKNFVTIKILDMPQQSKFKDTVASQIKSELPTGLRNKAVAIEDIKLSIFDETMYSLVFEVHYNLIEETEVIKLNDSDNRNNHQDLNFNLDNIFEKDNTTDQTLKVINHTETGKIKTTSLEEYLRSKKNKKSLYTSF